ncbi:MAG: RecQ family ATP-dependent helicase [Frankiales bacterium]|nr:RecQ family ATP-dependent helicase [Frankiales bacterium]
MTKPTAIEELASTLLGVSLRASQRGAIESILSGRDTLAVLPTGSGKSAIYQVAGLALGGLTVVVSPLIALQRDQLRSLTALIRGDGAPVRAAMLNSTQRTAQRAGVLADLSAGTLDFLLLSPEQLGNAETHTALAETQRPVTLVAVDEAHLVSEWGHDFRPEYLNLPATIEAVGRPAVLALTATAAPPVQADITRQLKMRAPHVIVADFDRPNIDLAVRRTRNSLPEAQAIDDRTVEVVIDHETPALVYALSHVRCESLAERLSLDSLRAAAYHAGLPAAQRSDIQDRFFSGRLDVIVATSAFGMGIDKSDVRTVVHAGVPGSLDEYYQEIGRAGRDGQPAHAVLVYDPRTVRIPRLLAARSRISAATIHAVVDALEAANARVTLRALADTSKVNVRTVQRVVDELLELGVLEPDGTDAVQRRQPLPADTGAQISAVGDRRQAILASQIDAARHYGESVHCRRAELLGYFGENYPPPCGSCDNDRASGALREPASDVDHSTGGVRVRHQVWGTGTLLSQDDHELVVAFDSVGYRHLVAASLHNGLLTLV